MRYQQKQQKDYQTDQKKVKVKVEDIKIMKDKLKVLALWLKHYSEPAFDPYTEGVLEAQLRQKHDETIQKIGDYLEEILEMDDEQIKDELK